MLQRHELLIIERQLLQGEPGPKKQTAQMCLFLFLHEPLSTAICKSGLVFDHKPVSKHFDGKGLESALLAQPCAEQELTAASRRRHPTQHGGHCHLAENEKASGTNGPLSLIDVKSWETATTPMLLKRC